MSKSRVRWAFVTFSIALVLPPFLNCRSVPMTILMARNSVGYLGLAARRSGTDENVLCSIRLPRLLVAALVGAGLASNGRRVAGHISQPNGNPAIIIGVSSGGSLGAVLTIQSDRHNYPSGIRHWVRLQQDL